MDGKAEEIAEFKRQMYDYIKRLAKFVREQGYGYKYLTFDTGCQMLENRTLQFTRGDKINDEFDLSISKFDLSLAKAIEQDLSETLRTKLQNKITSLTNEIKTFSICSLGMTEDNPTLWKRYATNRTTKLCDGICVEIDLDKTINYIVQTHKTKIFGIPIFYKESTDGIIKPVPNSAEKEFQWYPLVQLFQTKTIDWQDEHELRLVNPQPIEQEYCRFVLPPNCFSSVIVGKDVSDEQYIKVCHILSTWQTDRPLFPKISNI
jgi:hypothetical protein